MMIFVRDCNQMLFWLDDFSASSVAAFKNTMRVCAPCALLHFLFGSQQSFRSRQSESLQELGITKQAFYIFQINLFNQQFQKCQNLNNVPFLCTMLFQKKGHYSRGDIIQGRTLFKKIRYIFWAIQRRSDSSYCKETLPHLGPCRIITKQINHLI